MSRQHNQAAVLVLGVGGNVGQGIVKALRMARRGQPPWIAGACIDPLGAGLFQCDEALLSPPARAPEFEDWLRETCRRYQITGILSGVEQVLAVLAGLPQREGLPVAVVSAPEPLRIAGDKLLTCEWLRARGLAHPGFAASGDAAAVAALRERCGLPLIAKPRDGKGSAGVMLVDSDEALARAAALPGYVIQEHVGRPDHEYTAAVFRDRDGRLRGCVVMRRELKDGTTVVAEAGDYPAIRAYAEEVTRQLQPAGPCNIQMRLNAAGAPVCFEINCRFSGTTPMRAHFGFNDVELGYRHFVLGEPAWDLPDVHRGMALRYWHEEYVTGEAVESLRATGHWQRR